MNLEMLALWNYYHWTAILFVAAIVLETVIAWLITRKPEVGHKIKGIGDKSEKVCAPIRPVRQISDNRANTKNDYESNP